MQIQFPPPTVPPVHVTFHEIWWWSSPEWLSAIGTIAAVLVAIFGAAIWELLLRPRLDLSIKMKRPDYVKTFLTFVAEIYDCYYFRVLVVNRGWRRAEDVEVYAEKLEREVDGEYVPMNEFPPMDLVWSHIKRPLQGISPGLHKHCDLGYIAKRSLQDETRPKEEAVDDEIGHLVGAKDVQFVFDLEVKPNQTGWVLDGGKYRLTLALAAANASVKRKSLIMYFSGKWQDTEEKMFTKAGI